MKWTIFGYALILGHLPAIWFTPYGLLGVYGFGIAVIGFIRMLGALEASRWPTVPGLIVRSAVTEGSYVDQGELGGYDAPDVKYRYEVQGVTYHGTLLRRDDQFKTRWRFLAERWTARYPSGASVAVRVDPSNPSRSSLRSVPVAPWLLPMAGGAGGVAIAVTMFREAVAKGVPGWVSWNYVTFGAGAVMVFALQRIQRGDRGTK